ncbi:MAG: M28 family peptidase [Cyclobacteriaceae bacterium]|nr:M28 family peptidase [Cyclobacteriaceae bacterium]
MGTIRSGLFITALFFAQVTFAQYSFNAEQLSNDLKIISSDSLEGRKVGSAGNAKARTFIIERLKSLGIKPLYSEDYIQSFSITQTFGQAQTGNGSNVLGVIEGNKKETIVISAHYDHLGILSGKIYNGTDDNASGTAALLAIAEYFSKNKPEHRIILAFFDAEEMGLRGSAHFVNSINLETENIVLNINMDMISRSDKNELYACGTYHYPNLKKPIENISLPENFTLKFGHDVPGTGRNDWTSQSDQLNFHLKKIPFVYFGVEDHADYHRPTDDFDRVNVDFYHKSVEAIIRAVNALDKALQ